MKLKVKRKYRPSKFKKHFKKTYKKKNRTHRVKKHRKNKTKNNRRKSKKYFGGSTQLAKEKGPKLLQESLMKEIKNISTKSWRGSKTDESANCKKLNGLVDKMHKLESSTAIDDLHNAENRRVKVYFPQSVMNKKQPKIGILPKRDGQGRWYNAETGWNGVNITWNDTSAGDIELRIMNHTGDGFTKGKEFMFVDAKGNYEPYNRSV